MTTAAPEVHVISHPLVQHKLTLMRQKDRSTSSFRRLLGEIGMLMAYEVTRDMPTQLVDIETPLEAMKSPVIDGKKTVLVSIMRAGDGFLDGMLSIIPGARVGHVGLYRDEQEMDTGRQRDTAQQRSDGLRREPHRDRDERGGPG